MSRMLWSKYLSFCDANLFAIGSVSVLVKYIQSLCSLITLSIYASHKFVFACCVPLTALCFSFSSFLQLGNSGNSYYGLIIILFQYLGVMSLSSSYEITYIELHEATCVEVALRKSLRLTPLIITDSMDFWRSVFVPLVSLGLFVSFIQICNKWIISEEL